MRLCVSKAPGNETTKGHSGSFGRLWDAWRNVGCPTGAHLEHQPQLSSRQVVRLVEHAVELDHVGVVGQRAQDVVLGLDLLVHVLESAAGRQDRRDGERQSKKQTTRPRGINGGSRCLYGIHCQLRSITRLANRQGGLSSQRLASGAKLFLEAAPLLSFFLLSKLIWEEERQRGRQDFSPRVSE